MLELWKPLLILKDKDNPVIFNELELPYSEWDYKLNKPIISKDHHPFIIFYDDKEDCYYYLKARNAWDKKKKTYKKSFKSEILVESSKYKGLLSKDSYVDCSQIFKCNRELLESLIDKESVEYKDTDILSRYDQINILDTIKDNIFEIPPYLSIVEVKLDENGNTFAESLYLCDEKIDYYWEIINNTPSDVNVDLRKFESSKDSEFKQNQRRFQNGIQFCKIFLKEYFPDDINGFQNIQKITNQKNKHSNSM